MEENKKKLTLCQNNEKWIKIILYLWKYIKKKIKKKCDRKWIYVSNSVFCTSFETSYFDTEILNNRLGFFLNLRLEKYKHSKDAKHEKLFKTLMSYLLSHCYEIKFKKSVGKNQSLARVKTKITWLLEETF